MLVRFSRKFSKTYDKAPAKIRNAFDKRLKLFLENPFHSQLNNHALTGKYSDYRSINITGDWRALFEEFEDKSGKVVIFEVIGTHSQLYK